jgi:hypothetical protein
MRGRWCGAARDDGGAPMAACVVGLGRGRERSSYEEEGWRDMRRLLGPSQCSAGSESGTVPSSAGASAVDSSETSCRPSSALRLRGGRSSAPMLALRMPNGSRSAMPRSSSMVATRCCCVTELDRRLCGWKGRGEVGMSIAVVVPSSCTASPIAASSSSSSPSGSGLSGTGLEIRRRWLVSVRLRRGCE